MGHYALDPAPHPELLSGKRLWIDPSRLEGLAVLALHEDGEILAPILVEVEIEAAACLADLSHRAFDKLVAAGQPPEPLHIAGVEHAISPGAL